MKKIILFSCFLSVLSLAIEPKLNYAVDKNGNIIINGEKDFKNLTENSFENFLFGFKHKVKTCLLYTSPSPRDISGSRMPSSA